MTTFRTTLVVDFDVEEGTDPDEFHDELRDSLESSEVHDAVQDGFNSLVAVSIDTIRDINVQVLDD